LAVCASGTVRFCWGIGWWFWPPQRPDRQRIRTWPRRATGGACLLAQEPGLGRPCSWQVPGPDPGDPRSRPPERRRELLACQGAYPRPSVPQMPLRGAERLPEAPLQLLRVSGVLKALRGSCALSEAAARSIAQELPVQSPTALRSSWPEGLRW